MILSTTIYEKNFRQVLNPDSWFFSTKNNLIAKKTIIVNNVSSLLELNSLKDLISEEVEFISSDLICQEALDFFNCDLSRSESSYWYSIQHFCGLYDSFKKGEEFFFHIGADCTPFFENLENYIEDSMRLLNSDESVLATTIPWSEGDFTETGMHEQNIYNITKRSDLFWFSKVFSDQIFFTSVSRMKQVDFNIKENIHPFPGYGGDSFEKRLCNYMIVSDKYRSIYKKNHYIHKSF